MNLLIFGFIALFVIFYFFAYRKDYKRDPKGFKDATSYIRVLIILLLIKVASNVFENIQHSKDDYGFKFNQKREELGLVSVPETWIDKYDSSSFWKRYFYGHQEDYTSLYFESDPMKRSLHSFKLLQVEDDQIREERDLFKKGKTSVFLIYDFNTAKLEFELMVGNLTTSHARSEAIDTLRKWGITAPKGL
ncbi:hypothetical protein [Desertivirga arenae]|uniref:hypothetical protein n=1 Tax=Desertivirga arenae TaxID=2810309 RepID=UPI001A96F765|nr:hypothetical protein [Pedobacter sp. SYSU D00823]